MGSTGAVPGSEAGGDRGVRDGMVSRCSLKRDKAVIPVALVVCVEHGNKESDGDSWCHTGSRTWRQPNKRKVSAIRRTHAASLPYMMDRHLHTHLRLSAATRLWSLRGEKRVQGGRLRGGEMGALGQVYRDTTMKSCISSTICASHRSHPLCYQWLTVWVGTKLHRRTQRSWITHEQLWEYPAGDRARASARSSVGV